MKYLILLLIWGGYCFLHSFLISISFTKFIKEKTGPFYSFFRLFYVVISVWLLIPLINYSNHFEKSVILPSDYPWSVIRYTVSAAALAIFFWAFFLNYDVLSFFGIRQIMNIRKPAAEGVKNEISNKGLLSIVRHPMYFALIVYLWSQTYTDTDIFVNALLTVYVIIGTFLEEKKLVLEFGESYINYKKEVPMLIHFTKRKI